MLHELERQPDVLAHAHSAQIHFELCGLQQCCELPVFGSITGG